MNNTGKSLRPLKLHRRTAIGCFLMVLALTAACGADQTLPPSGELTTDEEELVARPHSTFWKLLNPITKGELAHRVDAVDVPIGVNVSPMGGGGLTNELNDRMMATQIPIAAGRQGEVKQSVEAGQTYAVFIINETDKPAKVKLRTTLRWGTPPPAATDHSPGKPGLQLYSLRALFSAKGVQAGLNQAKEFGFTTVELAGTYNLKPAEFLPLLEERGLKPVSCHFAWDRWKSDPEGVAAEAKALGLEQAGCAWANHKDPFDEAQAREVIEVFNRAGAATRKLGIRFFYHLHGFEFVKHGNGTLADLLITGSNPDLVSFQMDVLWVFFPGQDPASWLLKYPGRWTSLHLKDLRKGVERGPLTGKTDVRNDVALGTGQVDWPSVLAAAKKAGVKYYFIEDESPDVLTQIPVTLQFLQGVRF